MIVGTRRIAIVLTAAVLLPVVTSGCGGGDSNPSGDSKNSSASGNPTNSNPPPQRRPIFESGARPGREVVKLGEEASDEEREAVSAVLEEHFKAREAGEWAKQCATMTFEQAEEVRQTTIPEGNCAKGLRIQATPLAKTRAFRANPMAGPVDALRVEGHWGFALYRGKDGNDYAMLMKKEDGAWKVDDLVATRLF